MGLKKSGAPLSDPHRERLRALIEKRTHGQAAALMGISEQTLDRAIGGLPLMPGTRVMIEVAIAKRDEQGKAP